MTGNRTETQDQNITELAPNLDECKDAIESLRDNKAVELAKINAELIRR